MSDAIVIEINNEAAGIVIEKDGEFFFYASNPRYFSLEGSSFSSPSKAEYAARALKLPALRRAS